MSPAAFMVLSSAYEKYMKTRDHSFSCQPSGTDLSNLISGIKQLATDGYIEEVPDFVFETPTRLDPTRPIKFRISDPGIEYMDRLKKINQ
ncbi:MAG: hypothetical protein HDT16_02055 [Oscillibacter sp.]|nr:hypothetical protein [Oscillibacter sp.]